MKRRKQIGLLLLMLTSYTAAQTPAVGTVQVEKLQVLRDGGDVRVEVTLSAQTSPSVEIASNPDRLVIVLPNTISDAKQQRAAVNINGIRSVRIGLNSANPPITRVVIDLDRVHPYTLSSEGNRIVVRIQPASTSSSSAVRRSAPPAASSGSLAGIFHRRPKSSHPVADNSVGAGLPPPPEPLPPIKFPDTRGAAGTTVSTSEASNSKPSAANPDRTSLQQGTVFPGLGSPGTGSVPAASASSGSSERSTSATVELSTGQTPPATGGASQSNSNQSLSPINPVSTSTSAQAQPTGVAAQPSSLAPQQSLTAPGPDSAVGQSSVAASASTSQLPALPQMGSGISPSSTSNVTPDGHASSPAATTSSASVQPIPQTTANSVPPPNPADSAPLIQPNNSPAGSAGQPAAVVTDSDLPALALRATNSDLRTTFKVKYVAQGAAYLDGGRSAGLAEGMKLVVRESTSLPSNAPPSASNVAAASPNNGTVAELEVISVAETSAVTEVHTPTRDVKPGDLAYLSSEDQEALVQKNALSATRKYPTVISFTEGDTLDEEAREEIPRPPLPSVNRARGAIGLDYMGTVSHGAAGSMSSDLGMVVRTDITRMGGTYWNLSGYWRGRLDSRSSTGQPTLQDLVNRTYHLGMTYDNPQSAWVAGFGRLYLPWASSLDTIDGGYFGRRFQGTTMGIFGGSTPDPTSWDYNPDRRIAGTFVNFDGGSYDAFRYTSTSGVGISTLKWQVDRPFVFLENGFFYKRYLSIYHSLQADSPRGNQATTAPGPGVGRSFLTVRVQPIPRLEFDFNHTYFRDVPTFDPTLIGTGLLDKFLFQGFSAGVRVELVKQISVYTDLGRSSRTGDARGSLNQMYGVTWGRLPWFRLRADAHYSRFNSSFGTGSYRSFSLSRNLGDNLRLEVLAGDQNFVSTFSANNHSRFINTNIEAPLGKHYFLQGVFTTSRGDLMSYDQWMFTLGYRFDSRQKHQ